MDFPRCPVAEARGKPSLWATAAELSGVSVEEAYALDAAQPCLYDRLGGAAIQRLSTLFYERVYGDTSPLPSGALLRHTFANTTKASAAATQAAFLTERLGGPKLYTQQRGTASLIGRHAPYAGVTHEGAARWVKHMESALAHVPEIGEEEGRMLRAFFRFHAAWIVEGKQLVNPHRLLGYSDSKHMPGKA
jgi:truncated hemoglobin YjbI